MEWATQRFQQLDPKKARRIIDAAVSEFATKGYEAAKLIKQGQQRGDIRTDLPAEVLAFTVDNTMVMMQYSLSTPYFKGRSQLYQMAPAKEFAEQMTEMLWSTLEKRQ